MLDSLSRQSGSSSLKEDDAVDIHSLVCEFISIFGPTTIHSVWCETIFSKEKAIQLKAKERKQAPIIALISYHLSISLYIWKKRYIIQWKNLQFNVAMD